MIPAVEFTFARHVSADRVKRYLVWIRRGPAVACHLYEAPSGAAAVEMARAELLEAERLMNAI